MAMPIYADIILPLAVMGRFTYSVPAVLANDISIGARVRVKFGRKNF